MTSTVTLRCVAPHAPLDLPLLGRVLDPGQEFDCPTDLAGVEPSGTPGEDGWDPGHGLLAQVDNFVRVDGDLDVDAMNDKQIKAYAAANDVDLAGTKTKAERLAAVKAAQAAPVVTEVPDDEPVITDPDVLASEQLDSEVAAGDVGITSTDSEGASR